METEATELARVQAENKRLREGIARLSEYARDTGADPHAIIRGCVQRSVASSAHAQPAVCSSASMRPICWMHKPSSSACLSLQQCATAMQPSVHSPPRQRSCILLVLLLLPGLPPLSRLLKPTRRRGAAPWSGFGASSLLPGRSQHLPRRVEPPSSGAASQRRAVVTPLSLYVPE